MRSKQNNPLRTSFLLAMLSGIVFTHSNICLASTNCETISDEVEKMLCYEREINTEIREEKQKQAEFNKRDHSVAMHNGVEFEELTDNEMKLPQYRKAGSLRVRFEGITEDGKVIKMSKYCTTDMGGKAKVLTARHCFLFDPEDAKVQVVSIKAVGAQLTMNKEVVHPNVFDLDLSKINYDDPKKYPFSESASFLITEKLKNQYPGQRKPEYLGEILGYSAISLKGEMTKGSKGNKPYPEHVKDPCNAVYNNPDERDNVQNRILGFADEHNRYLIEEHYRGRKTLNKTMVDVDLIQDNDFRVCGTGFTNHKIFELSIVNCHAGGFANNQIATNCSQKPGFSGGRIGYIDEIKDVAVLIAQFNNRSSVTTPDEEGRFGPHLNLATLPSRDAVTIIYNPNTKERVATVLSSYVERLAGKEQAERGQVSSSGAGRR